MRTSILIIDRDENAVKELRRAFELQGAEVLVTPDGEEGLSIADADAPALIILAIELQTTSGYSVCKKIKRNAKLTDIPLFITSSTATPDIFEQHKRLETRAEEYFFKPLDVPALLTTAQSYVPIGGETVVMETSMDDGLIEVSDDLIISDDVDVIEVDEPATDQEPTRVVDAFAVGASGGFDAATEAELDSAIGELSGVLGEGQDDEIASQAGVEFGGSAASASESRLASAPYEAGAPVDDSSSSLRAEINRLTALLKNRDEQFAALRTSSSASEREFLALRNELNKKERDLLELKDLLYTKDSELLELRERSGELDARISSQEQEISALMARLSGSDAKRKELLAELETVRNEAEKATGKLSEFELRHGQLSRSHEAVTEKVQLLEGQVEQTLAELTEARQNAENELKTLSDELDQTRETLEQTRSQLEGALAEAQQNVAELEANRDELQKQVEVAQGEIDELKTAKESTEDELNGLKNNVDELEAAKQKLEDELGDSKRNTEVLESLKLQLESDLEASKAQLEEIETAKQQVDEALDASNSTIEELKANVEKLEADLESAKTDTLESVAKTKAEAESEREAAVEAVRAELQQALDDANREREDQMTTLGARIASRDELLEVAKATEAELKGEIESVKDELTTIQSELESTKGDLATAQSDLETATSGLETATSELATAQSDLETAQSDLETAQSDLKTAKGELATAKNEIETLNAGMTSLRSELDSSNSQVESTKKALDDLRDEFEGEKAKAEAAHLEATTELLNRIDALADEKNRLEIHQQSTIEDLEEKLHSAEALAVGREKELDARAAEIEAHKSEIEALRNVTEAHKGEIEALKQDQAAFNLVLEESTNAQQRLEEQLELYRAVVDQIASLATGIVETPQAFELDLDSDVVMLAADDIIAAEVSGPTEAVVLEPDDLEFDVELGGVETIADAQVVDASNEDVVAVSEDDVVPPPPPPPKSE